MVNLARKIWTEEHILKEFEDYKDSGKDIRSSAVQKNYRAMFDGIRKHYGGYREFIESLGMDYHGISSKRDKWTVEDITREFTEYAMRNSDLTARSIRQKRNDLYCQITKKIGSYIEFVAKEGYGDVTTLEVWDADKVIAEITERYDNGDGLSYKQLKECGRTPLTKAATRYFGSLENAITQCGINYDNVLEFTFWDKEKIKQQFLEYYYDPSIYKIEQIYEMNRGLDHAIRNHFGGYDALCDEMRLDVTQIRAKVHETSKHDLLDALTTLRDEGYPMNIMSVKQRFNGVWSASNKYFGSYEKALAHIGVDLNDHISERVFTSYAGREFEKVLSEMFVAIGKDYAYQYRGIGGIIPDFYESESGSIIDAKLSSWSIFNCDTLEKYLPHCEKLVIVYLRGEPIDPRNDKVELREITHYYDELRTRGLTEFIDEFERIKESLTETILKEAI